MQKYIDSIFTDKKIRSILTNYLRSNPSPELYTLLFRTGPKTIRTEFYVNVSAGMVLSVRRYFTEGRSFDGPAYGYALSLGIRPENLTDAFEFIRLQVFEKIKTNLEGKESC